MLHLPEHYIIIFSRLVPVTKAIDLARICDEKLRLLRKLKLEYFDKQDNLLSLNSPRSYSHS
jgi:hypothetical protein